MVVCNQFSGTAARNLMWNWLKDSFTFLVQFITMDFDNRAHTEGSIPSYTTKELEDFKCSPIVRFELPDKQLPELYIGELALNLSYQNKKNHTK